VYNTAFPSGVKRIAPKVRGSASHAPCALVDESARESRELLGFPDAVRQDIWPHVPLLISGDKGRRQNNWM